MHRNHGLRYLPPIAAIAGLLLIGCGGGGSGGSAGSLSAGNQTTSSAATGGLTGSNVTTTGGSGGATSGGSAGATTGTTSGGSSGATTGSGGGGAYPFMLTTDTKTLGSSDVGFETLPENRFRISADFGDFALGIEFPAPKKLPVTLKLGDPVLAVQQNYGNADQMRFSDFVQLTTAEYPQEGRWYESGGPGTGVVTIAVLDSSRVAGTYRFDAYGYDLTGKVTVFRAISGSFDFQRSARPGRGRFNDGRRTRG